MIKPVLSCEIGDQSNKTWGLCHGGWKSTIYVMVVENLPFLILSTLIAMATAHLEHIFWKENEKKISKGSWIRDAEVNGGRAREGYFSYTSLVGNVSYWPWSSAGDVAVLLLWSYRPWPCRQVEVGASRPLNDLYEQFLIYDGFCFQLYIEVKL